MTSDNRQLHEEDFSERTESMRRMGRKAGMTDEATESVIAADQLREQLAGWKTEAHEKESARAALQAEVDRLRWNDQTLDEAYQAGSDEGANLALDREKLAEVIEDYVTNRGSAWEFRSYDLADRIRNKLVPNDVAHALAAGTDK